MLWAATGLGAQTPPVEPLAALNRASAAELAKIPGVGPVAAHRIVGTRRQIEGFRSLEELHAVPGLSATQIDRIRRTFAAPPAQAAGRRDSK